MKIFQVSTGGNNKFSPWTKEFWLKILVMTVAIIIVSLTSLAHINSPIDALLAALIISLLNAFLKPLLSLFSLPLIAITFGLFMLIINALIVLLTSKILSPGFYVKGFGDAFLFSIVVTILSFVLELPGKIKRMKDSMFPNNNDSQQEKKEDNHFTDYEDVTEQENRQEDKAEKD
jgi:putative membrane protein